jgi:hypothetical protein
VTVLAFQTRRAKRCDTRALELIRASTTASLIEETSKPKAAQKNESRALCALDAAVRGYVAASWTLTLIALAVLALALPAGAIALIIWAGEAVIQSQH